MPALPDMCLPWLDEEAVSETGELPDLLPEADGVDGEPVPLEDVPNVVEAWEEFLGEWQSWREEHDEWQELQAVYSELFGIHQDQQRLGEAYELLLGLGLLRWATPESGSVRRHVFVAQAALEFDAGRGSFTLRAGSEGARMSLELDMLDPSDTPQPDELRTLNAAIEQLSEAPWASGVEGLLRQLAHRLSDTGSFDPGLEHPRDSTDAPQLSLSPALILRRRSTRSFLAAVDKILRDLAAGGTIPFEVQRLCGEGNPDGAEPLESAEAADRQPGQPPAEIFFPLPANDEQLAILERLRTSRGVLVQGPPGTGKSHTIANLICHLLAEGRRVLVTAQTPRALAVLREKIPAAVSELCVSLLGNDRSALDGLERSVQAISEHRASYNAGEEQSRIKELSERLRRAREKKAELETQQRSLRERASHRQEIASGAYSGTAQRIAERVAAERDGNGWIPDTLDERTELPFGPDVFVDLRSAYLEVPPEVEAELSLRRPFVSDLMAPEHFEALVRSESHHRDVLRDYAGIVDEPDWRPLRATSGDLIGELETALGVLNRGIAAAETTNEGWVGSAIAEVLTKRALPLKVLRDSTEPLLKSLKESAAVSDRRNIGIAASVDHGRLAADAEDLKAHLDAGRSIGLFGQFYEVVRRTKYFRHAVTVDGRSPRDSRTLDALLRYLRVRRDLSQLWRTWQGRTRRAGSTAAEQVAILENQLRALKLVLGLEEQLEHVGAACAAIGLAEAQWAEASARDAVLKACSAVRAERALSGVSAQLEEVGQAIRTLALNTSPHPVCGHLAQTVDDREPASYARHVEELRRLDKLDLRLEQREERAAALRAVAPQLAKELAASPGNSVWESRLPRIRAAWDWSRASSWLDQPARLGGEAGVGQQIRDLDERIGEYQAELCGALAWAGCFERMSRSDRQHLVAWQQAMRRVGRGTGRHAARHLRDARSNLQKCRGAIPAWVMPLHRLFDTISPEPGMFEVVIVDEASQCGPDALILNYIADHVVIVGDDQQISPEAVGLNRDKVFQLIDRHLPDVEHKESYTVENSLFAHGEIRYGNRIVLREHFRCMPEIIRFSNDLCYPHQPLKALRQYPADRLRPLVSQHVPGGFTDGSPRARVNRPEADALIAAVVACCNDDRYRGATMGVVSLQGEAQARLIEAALLEHLDAKEIEKRRLVCGDAYSFQGDERDVMFLSLVAAPNNRIGTLSKGPDKRRFNVAASRARDQMWLFHTATLNDLSEQCLRHQLLRFFTTPHAASTLQTDFVDLKDLAARERRDRLTPPRPFDSWFEVDVFLLISDRGYRVRPQFEVGGYRIDLVVEGIAGRVAVECDGDEWHGADNYAADMARQRTLERCGWEFWRVRGSEFYLNPAKAMTSLWKMLQAHDIHPWVSDDNGNTAVDGYVPTLPPLGRALSEDEEDRLEPTRAPPDGQRQARERGETVASGDPSEDSHQEGVGNPRPQQQPSGDEAPRAVEAANPAQESDLSWAEATPAENYFDLSHWAKLSGKLKPWERSMLYSIGQRRARGMPITQKQAKQARRVFAEAAETGWEQSNSQ